MALGKDEEISELMNFFGLICRWLYSIYNSTSLHGLLVFSLVEQKLSLCQTQLGDKHYVWLFFFQIEVLGYSHRFLIKCNKVFQETFSFLNTFSYCSCYTAPVLRNELRKWFQLCLLGQLQLINLLCISQPRLMLLSCLKHSCILSVKSWAFCSDTM